MPTNRVERKAEEERIKSFPFHKDVILCRYHEDKHIDEDESEHEGKISSPKGYTCFSIDPSSPPPVGSNFNTAGTTSFHVNVLNSGGGTVYYGSRHRIQKQHWRGWKDWSVSGYTTGKKPYPASTPTGADYYPHSIVPYWFASETGQFRFIQESYIYSPGQGKVTSNSIWITFTVQP